MNKIKCKCGSSHVELDVNNRCTEEGEDWFEWSLFCYDCKAYTESSGWGEYDIEEIQKRINE
jgi:hypothetical protein